MLDTIIHYIPSVMVLLCVVSLFINGIKYKRILKDSNRYNTHLCWGIATCLIGILVIVLVDRSTDEAGFIAPIIMGLILMSFFWFMALLPITSLQNDKG